MPAIKLDNENIGGHLTPLHHKPCPFIPFVICFIYCLYIYIVSYRIVPSFWNTNLGTTSRRIMSDRGLNRDVAQVNSGINLSIYKLQFRLVNCCRVDSAKCGVAVSSLSTTGSMCWRYVSLTRLLYSAEQEVKVIWQKAPHGGPIPRLGVTPGGRKLYHWIPGVVFPISVP